MSNAYYCGEPGCDAGSGPTLSFREKLEAQWMCSRGHRNHIGYHGETKTEALIELEERLQAVEAKLDAHGIY